MIKINEIKIVKCGEKSRIVYFLTDNDIEKELYFEVDKEYEKYLCYERCDAVLMGILNHAMRTKQDIESKIPATSELLYNIRDILIPSLTKHDINLYSPQINCPIEVSAIENVGAVGTGVSCGVDSFHAIAKHYNSAYKDMNLTHLCMFNVGAFAPCYENYGIEKIKNERYEEAIKVAQQLNLPIILSNSNFAELFPSIHSRTYTYSAAFAIYSMQKFWKIYYFGSCGYDFESFKLKDNSDDDCGHYELLSWQCFSTRKLKVYSEGGAYNRLEKTIYIADNKLAQEHLNVCIKTNINCMKCHKCRRTILTLDSIGKLENFSQVFDLKYYNKNKKSYLKWLYKKFLRNDEMTRPIYEKMKNTIPFSIKFTASIEFFLKNILNLLSSLADSIMQLIIKALTHMPKKLVTVERERVIFLYGNNFIFA